MRRLPVLLVLGCAAALVVMGGASAVAAPAASHERIEVDDTIVLEGECAFPVEVHITGTLVTNVTPQGTIEAFPTFRVTFTNLDTGASISSPSPVVARTVSNDDGTATVYATGLAGHLIVPGEGLITVDVGRLVFITDETGEPIGEPAFIAGQFEGVFPALCDVLG
jgi:hypothetical protein